MVSVAMAVVYVATYEELALAMLRSEFRVLLESSTGV
jgi:hypothetical protein